MIDWIKEYNLPITEVYSGASDIFLGLNKIDDCSANANSTIELIAYYYGA